MVNTTLTYYKGADRENITITNLKDDDIFSAYDASWADTTNTTVEIVDESDLDTVVTTVSGADVVSVDTTTLVITSSSLSAINRGKYIARIKLGDGTDTWEGRFELRVK